MKNLIVSDEIFEYPETGDSNYGEDASGWAEAITAVAAEVRGPGSIPTTETILVGAVSGSTIVGDVTNLSFDTAYVQRISIEGFAKRTFLDSTPDLLEEFKIEGIFNGTDMILTVESAGDDVSIEFGSNGGQITFKYDIIANTDKVSFKFKASAIVDESYFN